MTKRKVMKDNPRFLEKKATGKAIPALSKRKKKAKAQKLARRKQRQS